MIRIILRLDDQMSDGLDKAAGKFDKLGSKMTSVGTKMTASLTLPIVAVGAAAVKAAVDWESAFTGVIKTVDGTVEELAELEDGLRNLATNSTLAALKNAHAEIAGIAEVAGQLGVGVEHIEDFTEVIGQLSMATNIAGEEGATMIAQFANVAKMPLSEVRNFGDAIVTLGNKAATTENDILRMATRLGSIADVGFKPDEILAFSSTLASLGITAELGGTNFMMGVNKMATAVAIGGDALNQMSGIAGVTASQFRTAFEEDAAGAMRIFIEGLGDLDRAAQLEALAAIGISGQEAARVFLTLAGNTELLSEQLNMASEAFRGNNALMDEATKRAETAAGNFTKMKNNANDLAITFGEILLPFFNKVVEGLTQLIRWFGELPAPVQNIIVIIAALVAAIGPLLIIVGSLVSAWSTISLAMAASTISFAAIIPFVTGLAASFATMVSTLLLALGPIGLLIIALTALGVFLFANKDELGNWAQNVANSTKKAGQSVANFGTKMNQGLSKAGIPVDKLSKQIEKMLIGFISGFKNIPNMLVNVFNLVVRAMTGIGGLIIQGLIQGMVQQGPKLIGAIGKIIQQVISSVQKALGIKSPSRIMMGIGENVVAGFNQGIDSMGGLGVNVNGTSLSAGGTTPTMQTSSIGGGGMGGGIVIHNLNIPPGTTKEQVDIIARELDKRVKKRR